VSGSSAFKPTATFLSSAKGLCQSDPAHWKFYPTTTQSFAETSLVTSTLCHFFPPMSRRKRQQRQKPPKLLKMPKTRNFELKDFTSHQPPTSLFTPNVTCDRSKLKKSRSFSRQGRRFLHLNISSSWATYQCLPMQHSPCAKSRARAVATSLRQTATSTSVSRERLHSRTLSRASAWGTQNS
jgi:hypothetical protein